MSDVAHSLRGRCVVVGVGGGIAAYKSAMLVSRLVQAGADVHVVMTAAATRFVTPLTFESLTGRPVYLDLFGPQRLGRVDHVELAHRADAVLIAPATANLIGKLAAGLADDFLTTVVIGTRAPVLIAPSMEQQMYNATIVQTNLQSLARRGYRIVAPGQGYLASGRSGQGRLPEPAVLLQLLSEVMTAAPADPKRPDSVHELQGVKMLVTAGPTREPLDPARFLSNASTGKMGYAIAASAARRGADVVLVSGPTHLPTPPGVSRRDVVTANEMFAAVSEEFDAGVDVVIKAAAVADFRPAVRHAHKQKKNDAGVQTLELVPNPDILAALGQRKSREILVGFAAETANQLDNARTKLAAKNLDLIVLNDINDPEAGFASDNNRVVMLWSDGRRQSLPLLSKAEVAEALLDAVVELLARSASRSV